MKASTREIILLLLPAVFGLAGAFGGVWIAGNVALKTAEIEMQMLRQELSATHAQDELNRKQVLIEKYHESILYFMNYANLPKDKEKQVMEPVFNAGSSLMLFADQRLFNATLALSIEARKTLEMRWSSEANVGARNLAEAYVDWMEAARAEVYTYRSISMPVDSLDDILDLMQKMIELKTQ